MLWTWKDKLTQILRKTEHNQLVFLCCYMTGEGFRSPVIAIAESLGAIGVQFWQEISNCVIILLQKLIKTSRNM